MKITIDTSAATLTLQPATQSIPIPPPILAKLQALLHPLMQSLPGPQEPAAGVADDDDGDEPQPGGAGPDDQAGDQASDIPTHGQMWQQESAARMKRRVAVADMT